MSGNILSGPLVALVGADEAGIAALQPARETLDLFAVTWRDVLWSGTESGAFDASGLRAIIVASADAILPSALSEGSGLPVVRVPISDGARSGIALLQDAATANLPAGSGPFATVAIGEAGAKNAALFIISMLGLADERLWADWLAFRQRLADAVLAQGPLIGP